MRNKLLGTVLIVLILLGGLQVYQNVTRSSSYGDDASYEVSAAHSVVEGIKTKIKTNVHVNHDDSSAEVMIEKSFNVRSGSALVVDIEHADVDIQTGSGSSASVTVTLNSRNMDRAREKFERMEWEVYEDGGNVYIKAESPRGNWNVSMGIDVTVVIPSTFDIDLQTSHGDVEMDDINGKIMLATSHGDVEFATIEGDRLSIRSSHGDISGRSAKAATVELETSHADISINEVEARRVTARTSHADVEISYLGGEASISTSHGDIDVFLTGKENASFETQHGDIEVAMDSGVGAELDFRAPQIRLDRGMTLKGEKTRERVEGSVNGGGRSIRARTTHGSIELSGR